MNPIPSTFPWAFSASNVSAPAGSGIALVDRFGQPAAYVLDWQAAEAIVNFTKECRADKNRIEELELHVTDLEGELSVAKAALEPSQRLLAKAKEQNEAIKDFLN